MLAQSALVAVLTVTSTLGNVDRSTFVMLRQASEEGIKYRKQGYLTLAVEDIKHYATENCKTKTKTEITSLQGRTKRKVRLNC